MSLLMKKPCPSIAYFLSFVFCFFVIGSMAQENAVVKFSVLDENNKFLSGLKSTDIKIRIGKSECSINQLTSRSDTPIEAMVMMDVSLSQELSLADQKAAVSYFIDNAVQRGKDKIAITQFSEKLELVQDLTADISLAKAAVATVAVDIPKTVGNVPRRRLTDAEIVQQLMKRPPDPKAPIQGATSIWDSLMKAIEVMTTLKSKDTRRIIVMLTDGINTSGDSKFKEAVEASIRGNIPVYAIGIGDDFYSGIDKKALTRIAEQTGGVAIFPQKKVGEVNLKMEDIDSSMHSYYEATFTAVSMAQNDKISELKIEFASQELRGRRLRIFHSKAFDPAKK